jgi:hypothetical protein
MPMRRRMRELRAAGLGAEAIARVIALDFGLPRPPSRPCVDYHAPLLGEAIVRKGAGLDNGRRGRVAA